MPPKVLLVTTDDALAEEIMEFLSSSCTLEDFARARTAQEAYDLFEADVESIRLIFISQELPSSRPDDTAVNFTNQVTKTWWDGLMIAGSKEDWADLELCQTYFGRDQIQSLTYSCRAFLKKDSPT